MDKLLDKYSQIRLRVWKVFEEFLKTNKRKISIEEGDHIVDIIGNIIVIDGKEYFPSQLNTDIMYDILREIESISKEAK